MSAAKKAGTATRGAPAPVSAVSTAARTAAGPRAPEVRPSTTSAGQSATAGASNAPAGTRPAPRKVGLTVSRVDPWSALKMSFLVSVALGIAFVVMMAVLWMILSGMGVFGQVNSVVGKLMSNEGQPFDVLDYVGFGRVVSLSIVFAVIDIVLMTAIATLGAFIYNVSANLVGGLRLTLTDD